MSEYKFMEEEIEYLTIRNKNLGQITVCLTSEYERLVKKANKYDCSDYDRICKKLDFCNDEVIPKLREEIKEKDEKMKEMQKELDGWIPAVKAYEEIMKRRGYPIKP